MRRQVEPPNEHSAAFTLIELLVVIVILGILMAVAVPTFLKQQAKAQDSRTQQYLTTAFTAIRTGTPDTSNQFPSSTSMVAWVQQSEPELTVQRASCYTGSATAPADAVLVDPSSSANSLLLCARSTSGNVWELSATATGAPTLINGTLLPLTFSGNEITDATRATDVQGDGLTSDSSTGIWEGTTNLLINGGFETNTTSWAAVNGSTISRVTSTAKFGSASLQVTTPGVVNDEGTWNDSPAATVSPSTTYTASAWVKAPVGKTWRFALDENNAGHSHLLYDYSALSTGTGSWQHGTFTLTTGASTAYLKVGVTSDPAAAVTFWVDGVQLEQKPYATPYVDTYGVTASRGNARVQAPSSLLNTTQGWVAMRVRLDWPASAPPSGFPFLFDWRIPADGNNRISGWYSQSASAFGLDYIVGGVHNTAPKTTTQAFAADTIATIAFAWDASYLYVSLNGSAFTKAARTVSTLTGLSSQFDIGSDGNPAPLACDCDVFWFASGIGTLTNADAAMINSWGATDPTRASFPSSAQVTMTWDGTGTTGSLK